MKDKRVQTLAITFAQSISAKELPLLRGAIIRLADSQNILYHNHKEDGLRYAYPQIQYRRLGGKAALVCTGDGIEAMDDLFAHAPFDITLGRRKMRLQVENMAYDETIVEMTEAFHTYKLIRWMPLNKKNYEEYRTLDGVMQRCELLQRLLTANILSMCKGVGVHIDKHIEVLICEMSEAGIVRYKDAQMQLFDIAFKSNLSLPHNIGLGKGVSIGYGTIERMFP